MHRASASTSASAPQIRGQRLQPGRPGDPRGGLGLDLVPAPRPGPFPPKIVMDFDLKALFRWNRAFFMRQSRTRTKFLIENWVVNDSKAPKEGGPMSSVWDDPEVGDEEVTPLPERPAPAAAPLPLEAE